MAAGNKKGKPKLFSENQETHLGPVEVGLSHFSSQLSWGIGTSLGFHTLVMGSLFILSHRSDSPQIQKQDRIQVIPWQGVLQAHRHPQLDPVRPKSRTRQAARSIASVKPTDSVLVVKPSERQELAVDDAVTELQAAPSAAGGQASFNGFAERTPESEYLAGVLRVIERHKRYPRSARMSRQSGQVEVGFLIQENGLFAGVHLVKSSSFEVLDEAALEAVRRANGADPIPSEIGRKSWDVVLPVKYELE